MSHSFKPTHKNLHFDSLVQSLRSAIASFPDSRYGNNTRYSMLDAGMAAFSIFFAQSPSWLDFQRTLQEAQGKNNAETWFGVSQIPSDNHIRSLLDEVPPSELSPVFAFVADALYDLGQLDPYRTLDGQLLLALDGTQYFSSNSIHCKQCNVKKHRNGTTTYSHTAITPVIVAPGKPRVIPLAPAFITPQDGHKKQDCENAAAKRWLDQYGDRYSAWKTTLLGDDLYCKQPLCESILARGLGFILVCKPDSHKTLYEWLAGIDDSAPVETLCIKRRKGKRSYTDHYRFAIQVPLRDGDDALMVNWCELTTIRDDGKRVYRNAFATNHAITADNVAEIVSAGRARWKVENENNNTLKTKGYHLSHNFGHGKQHLATVLATLNLLAFLFHTVLEMMDSKFRLLRARLPSRRTFFEHIRALTCYKCFDSFDALIDWMIRNLRTKPPNIR